MKKFLNKTIETLLELVYPNQCIVCRQVIEFKTNKWLCPSCMDKIQPISGKTCDICGVPIAVDGICSDCRDKKLYFKKAYCAYEYKGGVREAIHNIKFRDHPQNIRYFADKVFEYAKENGFEDADIVTFVPMYPKKERKRGFNQSAMLAKYLAKHKMGSYAQTLKKIKNTPDQHNLLKEERLKNLKGSFAATDENAVKGKKILLADDIYTTGSTVNECAKVLMEAGAESVEVVCIAIVNKRNTESE